MGQNSQLPQVQEMLDLLQVARDLSMQGLNRIEKLNACLTQIQGKNTFMQQCLKEQIQIIELFIDQNPELEILKTSKWRMKEALSHSLEVAQLSEQGLEILDLSVDNSARDQENIAKVSVLLRSVIACLDMITQEKMQDFIQTMTNNQNARNSQPEMQDLQCLKHHLKGMK